VWKSDKRDWLGGWSDSLFVVAMSALTINYDGIGLGLGFGLVFRALGTGALPSTFRVRVERVQEQD
jgi:hypothetical protein